MVEPVVVPILGEGALENASSVGSLLSALLPGAGIASIGRHASSTSRAANGLVPDEPSNASIISDGAGALMVDGGSLCTASMVGGLLSGLLPGAGMAIISSSTTGAAEQSPARASAPAAVDASHSSSVASSNSGQQLPVVKGLDRRIVRPKRHPASLPRKTAADKAAFKSHLADEAALTTAANHYDCGCALHVHGCYHALVTSLLTRRELPLLVARRLSRFNTDFDQLAPLKLQELSKCLMTMDSNDAQYFDFAVLGVKVCFDAKYWAEGYPRTTMHDYCVAAVHGRVKTRPQIKQDGGASSGSIRVDKFNVRSHAESYIVDEVKTAAEEQPNVQPYENIAGGVQLTAHIDPFIPCCSRCQRAVTEKKEEEEEEEEGKVDAEHEGEAEEEGGQPCYRLCDNICRYSGYVTASNAAGEAFAKPSLFRSLYASVMEQLKVFVRRHKGVSSECETCRVNNAVVALAPDARSEEQFDAAQHNLAVHRSVIERFRGEERASQMQSKRDIRLKNRDGLFHSMKDKASNRNTSCPWTPDSEQRGKNQNAVQINVHFMMMAMYGWGVCIPLALPWIKTKANYNCTCSWVGLVLLSQKLGYVPQHLSEHADRGDQNISLIPVGFFGTLISSGIIASAIVSSLFTGHGHGGERPSTIVDLVPK
jgi:hypothetical protein